MSFKYCVNMRLKVEKEKLDTCCHKKEEKKSGSFIVLNLLDFRWARVIPLFALLPKHWINSLALVL